MRLYDREIIIINKIYKLKIKLMTDFLYQYIKFKLKYSKKYLKNLVKNTHRFVYNKFEITINTALP